MKRGLAATLLAMLLAAPLAHAQTPAERALERAERLAGGQGVETGRELTGALRELSNRLTDLAPAGRRRARGLLARPTDGAADQFGDGYLVPEASPHCTTNFCVHYVTSGADAPSLSDGGDAGTTPDYVESVGTQLETSYAKENTELGWVLPKSDGTRGGDARTDVYLKELTASGIYGYAAPDPGQAGVSQFGYLVLDDDYVGYEPTPPLGALQVTAAHEYNHVLQFTYDIRQADWMYESTATWMEDVVFDSVNDYYLYIDPGWTETTEVPLTDSHDRIYGSAVWNHFLSERYGALAVRRAWERSAFNPTLFAPGAYDDGIELEGGPGFSAAFGDFAARSAAWEAAPAGFSEGASYGEVERRGVISPGAAGSVHRLDHTTFKLLDVPGPYPSSALQLSGSLPTGTAGAVALVGRTPANATTVAITQLPSGGSASVSLPNASQYERVTAVLVNASVAHTGLNGQQTDYRWADDNEAMGVALATGANPPPAPDVEPPDTTILSGPSATTAEGSATFAFSSTEAGGSFECSIDGLSFLPCSSPTTYSGLAPGSHRFEVAAIDAAGNRDPSTAAYAWTITGATTSTPTGPPPASGPSGTPLDTVRPAVAGLRFGARAFRALRGRGASIAAPRGATVTYSLSEAATVTFRARRLVDGRRVRVRGSFRHVGASGGNSFRFTGRVRGRPLRPGRYELRARAEDAAGNLSLLARTRFRIVRG